MALSRGNLSDWLDGLANGPENVCAACALTRRLHIRSSGRRSPHVIAMQLLRLLSLYRPFLSLYSSSCFGAWAEFAHMGYSSCRATSSLLGRSITNQLIPVATIKPTRIHGQQSAQPRPGKLILQYTQPQKQTTALPRGALQGTTWYQEPFPKKRTISLDTLFARPQGPTGAKRHPGKNSATVMATEAAIVLGKLERVSRLRPGDEPE